MPSRIPSHRSRFAPSPAEVRRSYDRTPARKAAQAFYNSPAWRALRAAFLSEFPLCNRCPADRPTAAVEVHHQKPRDTHPELELAWDNLEGLCRPCHRRTRPEDLAARERSRRP